MYYVLDVVMPLGGVGAGQAPLVANQPPRFIAVVLEHQMDRSRVTDAGADRRRKLVENIGRRVIGDGMDGIKAQTVEMKLLEPVERVVAEKLAHDAIVRPIEIDRAAPRRPRATGTKVGR